MFLSRHVTSQSDSQGDSCKLPPVLRRRGQVIKLSVTFEQEKNEENDCKNYDADDDEQGPI